MEPIFCHIPAKNSTQHDVHGTDDQAKLMQIITGTYQDMNMMRWMNSVIIGV
jgi:hypothetical protein